uniref:(northern house mosquito) hypothetical protein n=1 Tax=Culex pipiens TaxID=7175 RepID=A0A8D8NWZ5_CULPI
MTTTRSTPSSAIICWRSGHRRWPRATKRPIGSGSRGIGSMCAATTTPRWASTTRASATRRPARNRWRSRAPIGRHLTMSITSSSRPWSTSGWPRSTTIRND